MLYRSRALTAREWFILAMDAEAAGSHSDAENYRALGHYYFSL